MSNSVRGWRHSERSGKAPHEEPRAQGGSWYQTVGQDLRHALRGLRGSPSMAVSVVLTLALGIGAAVTMYGLMSRLLFQPPLHVGEPDWVAKLFFHYEAPGAPAAYACTGYYRVNERLRDQSRTVERAATYTDITVPVGAGADAARARATVVSAGFWDTLGTRAAVGRLLADDETGPAAARASRCSATASGSAGTAATAM